MNTPIFAAYRIGGAIIVAGCFVGLAAIGGCQTVQSGLSSVAGWVAPSSPSAILADAQLALGGLRSIAPLVTTLARSSASDVATVNTALADMQAAVTALQAQGAAGDKLSGRQIVVDIQIVAPIALKYLKPGSVEATVVNAAIALLPAFDAALGLAGASAHGGMTPEQARAILAAARGR
jgi:hypothetical protein